MRCGCLILLMFGGSAVALGPAAADPLQLGMPVACDLGRTCFIQSYVDIDPGAGVQDFACGGATYADHDGTDFRLLSARETAANIAVKAAAAGTVKAVRDGMPDRFASVESRSLIANRECGNGVVIDHGGGWETQYCHMLAGSLKVAAGNLIQKGAVLGSVGYSGLAEFAHLHLTVRHNSKAIDPFTGSERNAVCQREAGAASGLWDESFLKTYQYTNGEIIAAEFSDGVPDLNRAEVDGAVGSPTATSAQLVFFTRLINLKAGDRVVLDVTGPAGFAAQSTSKPLQRDKATWLAYTGRRLKEKAWTPGRYNGTVRLVRDGQTVAEMSRSRDLVD